MLAELAIPSLPSTDSSHDLEHHLHEGGLASVKASIVIVPDGREQELLP